MILKKYGWICLKTYFIVKYSGHHLEYFSFSKGDINCVAEIVLQKLRLEQWRCRNVRNEPKSLEYEYSKIELYKSPPELPP